MTFSIPSFPSTCTVCTVTKVGGRIDLASKAWPGWGSRPNADQIRREGADDHPLCITMHAPEEIQKNLAAWRARESGGSFSNSVRGQMDSGG